MVDHEDFERSKIEKEIYISVEEFKYPQEYDSDFPIGIFLNDINVKETVGPRVQAMFRRTRKSNIAVFKISQNFFELPKRTIRANGNIHETFKPNNFRDVQIRYQDKASIDITLIEFRVSKSTGLNEKNQTLTIDIAKVKYAGRFGLRLNNVYVSDSSLFVTPNVSVSHSLDLFSGLTNEYLP